ncbi:chemotaxis protein MotB [Aphanothece hegewaldii CCALA 016]|uniref:Chemotaxis protein MotB n=1 Tax=Aphanothece hegewaldii CCALA 016 TaxID=2107694 RepID=A0A2T1LQS1_9CHRO|nr:OmpA family protein [Aphanothece hegewaldii]PSF29690.1 chemotaxis protein MotB [Aphanothece hegewaldii CCALA 016]
MNDWSNWRQDSAVNDQEDSSVLLSIGDLMSGLLMIFALLFITVLVQLKEMQKTQKIVIGTVLDALKDNNVDVKVNPETGDVSIRDSILFDENSSELKPEGKRFLQSFIPVYSQVIFSKPLFEEEITRVIIEGHTSSAGNYETNLKLSLLRSYSVAEYIFSPEMKFSTKSQLSQKIMTAGRGEIESQQKYDEPSDRKVTFRFQFKGEKFLENYQKK